MPTVYRDLGATTEPVDGMETLFAGEFPRAEINVLIASGQAALPRGQVLTGTLTAATAYTGTGTVIGVLGVATPAATGGDVPAFMYVTGEFNEALLVGLDAAATTTFRTMNLYPKEVA